MSLPNQTLPPTNHSENVREFFSLSYKRTQKTCHNISCKMLSWYLLENGDGDYDDDRPQIEKQTAAAATTTKRNLK